MARKKKNIRKTKPQATARTGQGFLSGLASRVSPLTSFCSRYRTAIEVLLLLAVITAGVLFRIEDLGMWKTYKHKAFYDNQPLHTTFDAWFYLSLAKDISDGTYYKTDEKRGVPDCPPRPSPPPLISVLAALAAKATPLSISWIGALLPVVLGPLLAIPLYLLGRHYGGPLTGIMAALLALLYPNFIYRSNIGRFDTDCMNVFWSASAAYLFLRFGIVKTAARYFYFVGAVVVFGLFFWWWDQAPAAVAAVCFPPLLVALALFYRPGRKEGILFYGCIISGVFLFLFLKGFDLPLQIAKSIWYKYLYISKDTSSNFPNIGLTISEQSRPSMEQIVSYTTRSLPAFLFAAAGIALLFWRRFSEGLFLVSLIILSVLTFFFANRFIIFLIPVVALGTGFALSELWKAARRFSPLYALCPLIVVLLIWPLYSANKRYVQWPKEPAATVAGMNFARQHTPSDAVVWAWWDHGYALTYYARRATVNDGSIHSGERTVYTAIPFATDSFRLSANFMHFYVSRGLPGIKLFYSSLGTGPSEGMRLIKHILRSGPDEALRIIKHLNLKPDGTRQTAADWLEFFYPRSRRPVYLFLDNLLTRISYWVYWFGTWDIEQKEGLKSVYNMFYNVRQHSGRLKGNGLEVDMQNGTLFTQNRSINLSHLYICTGTSVQEKDFHQSGYRFEYMQQSSIGAMMDSDVAESVFNKLFLRHTFPERYFSPVRLNAPSWQLWEVTGDTLP